MAGSKKTQAAFGLAGSVVAATSAAAGIRKAKAGNDKLRLVNALASVAVAITGILIAVRSFRKESK